MTAKPAPILFSWAAPVFIGAALVLGVAAPAAGFALDENLTDGTSAPQDDLADAVRWTNLPGSLVDDGRRGLGGGVEYSLAPDLCDRLLPRFVDQPAPACDDLLAAVHEAFAAWAAGPTGLVFTDVSDRLPPELPPAGAVDARRGHGAEIDIVAGLPPGFPPPGPFGVAVLIWYLQADPVGTGGQPLPGNTLTGADILLNPEKCFYLDPILERGNCNHFGSIMLHGIARALGLGQPDVTPRRNWDSDAFPDTPVEIDCMDPARGLRLSRRFDRAAAAASSGGLGQRYVPGLTADDIAGRDFLYPSCAE